MTEAAAVIYRHFRARTRRFVDRGRLGPNISRNSLRRWCRSALAYSPAVGC